MFKKRHARHKRLAEEIRKQRGNSGEGSTRSESEAEAPQRVDASVLFAKMSHWRGKGGACTTP